MMTLMGMSVFAQKDNTLVNQFKRFGVFGEVNSEFDLGQSSLSPGVNGAFGFIFGDFFWEAMAQLSLIMTYYLMMRRLIS